MPGGATLRGLPQLRSGVTGIMEHMRLSEEACEATLFGEQSHAEPSHSALQHLCVSMDWSQADPASSQAEGDPRGQAMLGSSLHPPSITLSVKHRHRGKIIETVLVKSARPCGAQSPNPAFLWPRSDDTDRFKHMAT